MIMADVCVGSLVDPAMNAHAVLNASNPHVAMGSGVSGAIAEACGDGFQALVRGVWEDEFDEPLEPQDCLVTSAGDATAFRWVLHVPAVDYTKRDPETGGSSGPKRVVTCTKSALREALELSREVKAHFVLALPLLGAGHGGLGPVASAGAMMGAVRQFAEAFPKERMLLRFAVLETSQKMLIRSAAERHGVPLVDGGAS